MFKSFFRLLLLTVAVIPTTARAEFELAAPSRAATILIAPGESEPLQLAAQDLASDVGKITGQTPLIVQRLDDCAANCVVLATASNTASAQLLNRFNGNLTGELRGKWEAYRVESISRSIGPVISALVVAGSDERGAMFGLYAFIEKYLGVDPMYFWADREPLKRDRLAWDSIRIAADEPTFRYRGWFINDEDLLTEWREDGGFRQIEYPYYHQVTSPVILEQVFEAMLRLGYNIVIPASFTDIANPAERRMVELATRRGLYVSMHHVEPLGVSAFAFQNYWGLRGRNVPFSFVQHRKEFEEVWRYYAAQWAQFPNVVWQIGLRGIADRPVWVSDPNVPPTDEGRGKLIFDAMQLQADIIRSVDKRPEPPMTTTLWMEGADLNRKGHLRFPKGAAVIFSDNSPGWKLQPDFYETPREPGRDYGIYYHHALWGQGPHFVQAASPQKTHEIVKLAVDRNSHHYAMLNVSNVREFALGVDASARMLRDFRVFDPHQYLKEWCRARFGAAAEPAERAYRRFFASYVIDEKQGYPALLDGLTLHRGERIYGRLLAKALMPSGTLLSQPENLSQTLVMVQQQRRALEEAGAEGATATSQLQGADKTFFETNFVAQQKILLGLLKWLEAGIHATLAEEKGDQAQLRAQLRLAQAGMKEVRSGQALATRGKWQEWYRGDRKMNLKRAEYLTDQLLSKPRVRSKVEL